MECGGAGGWTTNAAQRERRICAARQPHLLPAVAVLIIPVTHAVTAAQEGELARREMWVTLRARRLRRGGVAFVGDRDSHARGSRARRIYVVNRDERGGGGINKHWGLGPAARC